MGRVRWLALVVVSVATLTSCAASSSSALHREPVMVCGTNLGADFGGGGFDISRKPRSDLQLRAGKVLYLYVSNTCDHGATVTWIPTAAAHLVKQASAHDGAVAGLALQATKPGQSFTVTARFSTGRVTRAKVTVIR
jgi:hypothetical protein